MEKMKEIPKALYRKIGIEAGKSMESHYELLEIIYNSRRNLEGEIEDGYNAEISNGQLPTKETSVLIDNLAVLRGMDTILEGELPKYKSYNYNKVILQ
jgi:hypothetical protein